MRYLARSVARFTWKHFTPAQFRAIQTHRGRRGGLASGQIRTQTALELAPEVRREQDTTRKRAERHSQGKSHLTRAEYLAQAEQRRVEARLLRAKGLSWEEVGLEMGISPEAARKLVSR